MALKLTCLKKKEWIQDRDILRTESKCNYSSSIILKWFSVSSEPQTPWRITKAKDPFPKKNAQNFSI